MRWIPSCLAAATLFSALPAGLAESLENTHRPHRSFRFTYSAGVKDVPADAQELRIWVPLPVDTRDQTIGEATVKLTLGDASAVERAAEIEKVRELGGTPVKVWVRNVGNGFGRTLCVGTPGKPVGIELAYDVTRYETRGGGAAGAEELGRALQADKMVPLGGKVSAMAEGLETKPESPEAARALYDHILERMRYDKPQDGGKWGRGDSEWACEACYGNCTDFHSYFMGLARTKKIPARFEMGFSIPGGPETEAAVSGYHCWAYFWQEGRGWVPVDISEADKHPEKTEYFFGTLDADRFTVSGGRDLVVEPAPAQGPLNFLAYPYVEVDGKTHAGIEKSFKRTNLSN
ncbi:MAG: transglutaminase-like domain-containing protein [Planctomycetota bacterium]